MIKITTTIPYGMFNSGQPETLTDTSKYKGLVNVDKSYTSSIYIHGDLEEHLGFDIPLFLEGDFSDLLKDKQTIKVIYDLNDKTIEEDALMFLWINTEHGIKKILGYIIEPGDEESIKYALKQQKNKPFNV